MRKMLIFLLIAVILCVLLFVFLQMDTSSRMTEENAVKRVEGFIKAVNDNEPALVYNFLTPEIKELISKEGFVENFVKERSYPYLTPLYLYLDHLELSEDKKTGHVECVVAARLPGERMDFSIVFYEDDYYIDAFRDIADGSFIKKFDRLTKNN